MSSARKARAIAAFNRELARHNALAEGSAGLHLSRLSADAEELEQILDAAQYTAGQIRARCAVCTVKIGPAECSSSNYVARFCQGIFGEDASG